MTVKEFNKRFDKIYGDVAEKKSKKFFDDITRRLNDGGSTGLVSVMPDIIRFLIEYDAELTRELLLEFLGPFEEGQGNP